MHTMNAAAFHIQLHIDKCHAKFWALTRVLLIIKALKEED